MGMENLLVDERSENEEIGLWRGFLDGIDDLTSPLRERTHKAFIKLTRQLEFYLVYKELERVRPKLSKAVREDLALYHIENSSDFYKRVVKPYGLC